MQPDAVEPKLTQATPFPHFPPYPPPCTHRCKQGTLQFVILKPVFSALALILFTFGLLDVGNWSPTNGYIYVALALNATYSVALFFLLQFYLGTRELLAVG